MNDQTPLLAPEESGEEDMSMLVPREKKDIKERLAQNGHDHAFTTFFSWPVDVSCRLRTHMKINWMMYE